MPRPGPRRQNVAVRMSAEQIAALDEVAEREGVERSEIVRRAVDAYAPHHTTKRPAPPGLQATRG